MFSEQQLYDNALLLRKALKQLVSEVVNAIPNELRICDKLDPHGVYIENEMIVLATGKRIDGYTIRKFWEAFETTRNSINNTVVEDLINCLQKDSMRFPSILNGINSGICSPLVLEKMWHRYQMLYQATKYRAVRIETTCLIPKTEFYRMPFVFDMSECFLHEFFNFDFWQYIDTLNYMANGGSIRDLYRNKKCVVRRNEADRVRERLKEQRNVSVSKTNSHFSPGRVKTPTLKKEQNMP